MNMKHMTLAEFHHENFGSKKRSGILSSALVVEVVGFCGEPLLIERLKELGFHQGLKLQLVGQAPFGGPQLYRFGNTVLALRYEEAACTLIQI